MANEFIYKNVCYALIKSDNLLDQSDLYRTFGFPIYFTIQFINCTTNKSNCRKSIFFCWKCLVKRIEDRLVKDDESVTEDDQMNIELFTDKEAVNDDLDSSSVDSIVAEDTNQQEICVLEFKDLSYLFNEKFSDCAALVEIDSPMRDMSNFNSPRPLSFPCFQSSPFPAPPRSKLRPIYDFGRKDSKTGTNQEKEMDWNDTKSESNVNYYTVSPYLHITSPDPNYFVISCLSQGIHNTEASKSHKQVISFTFPYAKFGKKFKSYYSSTFKTLRESCFNINEKDFIYAFNIEMAAITEGYGGIFYSEGEKYILQRISKQQYRTIRSYIQSYKKHMIHHSKSFLPRYCGLYQIDGEYYAILVNTLNVYSLKKKYRITGSNGEYRKAKSSPYNIPDYIRKIDGKIILKQSMSEFSVQFQLDMDFLKKHRLIDYSLVMGEISNFDPHQPSYCLGFIDIITSSSWKTLYRNGPKQYADNLIRFINSEVTN